MNIILNTHTPSAAEAFSRLGTVRSLSTEELTPGAVSDCDILVVRSETRVDMRLLEHSRVKFVGSVTIGTDHVDLEYLATRGITFANAPGSNARSVAEYVIAALLEWSLHTGRTLNSSTLGVVGVGHVGSKVAELARLLGMRVLLNDPPLARRTGDQDYRSLDDLMAADVLTLHVPLTVSGPHATKHLFDDGRFRKMKRGACLINTSRGAVVDSTALLRALREGQVGAAILDVWENEPAIGVDVLERAFLGTPHIAGYSVEGKLSALRTVFAAACRFAGGEGAWWPPLSATLPRETIAVAASTGDTWETVRRTVAGAYDIQADDRSLRAISVLPEAERPAKFRDLRRQYGVRREFSQWDLTNTDADPAATVILRALGFGVAG